MKMIKLLINNIKQRWKEFLISQRERQGEIIPLMDQIKKEWGNNS